MYKRLDENYKNKIKFNQSIACQRVIKKEGHDETIVNSVYRYIIVNISVLYNNKRVRW